MVAVLSPYIDSECNQHRLWLLLTRANLAIDAGIRHIVTVQIYETEATGEIAPAASFSKGEIYITSKCTSLI